MTLHEFRCDRTSTHHSLEGMEGQSPLRPPYPWSRGKLNTRRVKEQRNLTPTQACPRPGSLGRNLRSKTRWFSGFCNSHQVSHFATFFIDARAEISVAESRFDILEMTLRPCGSANGHMEEDISLSFPWRVLRRGSLDRSTLASCGQGRAMGGSRPPHRNPRCVEHVSAGLLCRFRQ